MGKLVNDSLMQEYAELKKSLGKEKAEALDKYLSTHPGVFESDVLYKAEAFGKFERWFKNRMKDSNVVDAQSYLFNWRNTYTGERGKTSIVAGSVEEATKKLAKDITLKGTGTANVYIVSVSPNDGYHTFYGKVSDLLRKYNIDIYDSGNVFVVKDSAGRLYRVFADSFDEAVSKVKNYKKF